MAHGHYKAYELIKMKFIIEGKAAATALTKLQRVAGKDINNIVLVAGENQTLALHAYGLQRRSMICVPASVQQLGKITIERERFAGICKGRGKLEFIISGNTLAFQQTGTGYAGKNISLVPYKEVELLKLATEQAIPEHIQARLLQAVRACLITSVFGGQQLGMTLLVSRDYFRVVTTDSYHSAIAEFIITEGERKRLRRIGLREPVILPMEYAEILARQFTMGGLTISANNKRITFANKEMKLELPALQSNTAMLQHALRLNQQFNHRSITITAADNLRGILDNIKVIGKTDLPLIFGLREGDKALNISYNAPAGRITDQMKLSSASHRNKKLRLEPRNLYDIASKLGKGDVDLAYNSRIIRITKQLDDLRVDYYSSQLQH